MKKNLVHAALSFFILIGFTSPAYPQWVPTNWPASTGFFDLYGAEDRVFARTWDSLNGGGMFVTGDNGATWAKASPADGNGDFLSVVMLDDGILAGTWNGFYRSDLGGTGWNAVTPAGVPADSAVCGLAMISATLYAGARGAVYVSSNGGASWSEVKSGIAANARITSFAACGGGIFAGSDSCGVFSTTNGGASWTAVNSGLSDRHIRRLAASGNRLFAVTAKGVFLSDNNGASWSANGSSLTDISCLAAAGATLFAGTENSGIFLSTDGGANWNPMGTGLPADARVWSLAVSGGSLFAGTSRGVWRCPFTFTEYTIVANASEGGSISPSGSVAVYEGSTQVFAITPSSGYAVSSVIVDGSPVGAVSTYTFSNVSGSHTIAASFINAPYTITASAGSGGSISPSGTVMVAAGSSQTFTIAASSGYEIAGVSVDGASVGSVSSYTLASVGSNHTISATFSSLTKYQINCGGSASAPYTADQYYSGGTVYSVTSAITTTGVSNPAPQAVYQTERYGAVTYTIPSLTSGASYKVRLHFSENYQTASGKRKFNVAIGGTTVLSGFDIYAETGARYKAIIKEFTAAANGSGQIVISFTTVTDNAKIDGIEIIKLVPNTAPTIATAASAAPAAVTGNTATLSVLGTDDGGEANLTYTWTVSGTPPAAVTFSVNGNNAAKATTATFAKAGSYTFLATIMDAGGLTSTSSVAVTVQQTLLSLVVSPSSASVFASGTQQFSATGNDQFSTPMITQPTFTWSAGGAGSIGASGLFSAGTTAGSATVTASTGSLSATAQVTVTPPNSAPTIAIPASAAPNPVTGNTSALSVMGADDGGESFLIYTWTTTGTPPAAVTFGANGTNAAKAATVTFGKAGDYSFLVTVRDAGGLTSTSSVTVAVHQTLSSIVISPASATVPASGTQQFAATGFDQFGATMSTQPTFTWSVSGAGSISASGLYSAGTTAGTAAVTATSAGVSKTAGVTVTLPIVYQINCGGGASSPYTADQYYSGGTARTVTSAIATAGVTDPAPQAVYQAERYGAVTYTLPSLAAGASYKVRLHFAETYWTASGKRKFTVAINGTTVLSNYDIYAATGARYKAVVKEYAATASGSGQIVIRLTNVTDNATIEGIQIIRQ